jgi:hypothetical protein
MTVRTSMTRQMTRRRHRRNREVLIGIASAVMLLSVLTAPVLAEISRLTSIPLGRGTATITWIGKGGITPTVNSVRGRVGGLSVSATDKVPRFPGLSGGSVGSTPTSIAIPSHFPIADVNGTIDGAPFKVDIVLSLSQLSSSASGSLGMVTGTFRSQKLVASLTADVNNNSFGFKGTIGSLHVSGVVDSVIHHGEKATAHASFDVTR